MYRRANGMKEFYSICDGNENVDIFIDNKGYPTMSYPHVHVAHHSDGRVDVIVSREIDDHPWKKQLKNPTAIEVKKSVDFAKDWITVKEIGLLYEGAREGHISLVRHNIDNFLCLDIIWRGRHINEVEASWDSGSLMIVVGKLISREAWNQNAKMHHNLH